MRFLVPMQRRLFVYFVARTGTGCQCRWHQGRPYCRAHGIFDWRAVDSRHGHRKILTRNLILAWSQTKSAESFGKFRYIESLARRLRCNLERAIFIKTDKGFPPCTNIRAAYQVATFGLTRELRSLAPSCLEIRCNIPIASRRGFEPRNGAGNVDASRVREACHATCREQTRRHIDWLKQPCLGAVLKLDTCCR